MRKSAHKIYDNSRFSAELEDHNPLEIRCGSTKNRPQSATRCVFNRLTTV
jgi:hypothetical protein